MATTQAEAAAQIQQRAQEALKGTDAVIGGRGRSISVSREQSRTILGALSNVSAELVAKDPNTLTVAEKQVLALIQKVGADGQVDGKEACQAMLMLERMRAAKKKETGNAVTRVFSKEQRVAKQSEDQMKRAEREIAIQILPPEATNIWERRRLEGAQKGLRGEKAFRSGAKAERITQEHPIIVGYEQRVAKYKAAGVSENEAHDKAMNEAIQFYGDDEVDRLMQEIEAGKKSVMAEDQKRQVHQEREEVEQELEAGRPEYEARKNQIDKLKKDEEGLITKKQQLEDDLDDLEAQIAALPATPDLNALRQEISNAKTDVTNQEIEIASTEIEIDILKKKIEAAKSATEKPVDTTAIQTQIDDLTRKKGEADKKAASATASESLEKTTIKNATRDRDKYTEDALKKRNEVPNKTKTAQTAVKSHETTISQRKTEQAAITDSQIPTLKAEVQEITTRASELNNSRGELAQAHLAEITRLQEEINKENDPDKIQALVTEMESKTTQWEAEDQKLEGDIASLEQDMQAKEQEINAREQNVQAQKDAINTKIQDEQKEIDRINKELQDFIASIDVLEQNAKAEQQKADEAQGRIDQNKITSAEQSAEVKLLGEQITLLNQKLKELQKQKGSLPKADVDAFIDQEEKLKKKLETLKVQKARSEQIVDQRKDALKKGEDMDTRKKKLENDRDAKQREYDKTDKQIIRNRNLSRDIKVETDKYEATQKKLVGVEKRVQAAEKAATEAKKLLESKKTSKAEICAHFGINPADIQDDSYIDAVRALYPGQPAGTIAEAQATMAKHANELSIWQLLMSLFAGAEIA